MKFLFKYSSRNRPEWFKETLAKWYSLLSGSHEYLFVVSVDEDDKTMNNSEMAEYCKSKSWIDFCVGKSKTKIQAINADMTGRDFDILVVVSDDMIPQVRGYDDIIANDMIQTFPQLDGALHYDDGCHGRSRTITLSIMGKRMYDHFGYIYYPDYMSVFCDNEFTDRVYAMDKVIYLDRVIIRHEWRGKGTDALYRANDMYFREDEKTYKARKAGNFTEVLANEQTV